MRKILINVLFILFFVVNIYSKNSTVYRVDYKNIYVYDGDTFSFYIGKKRVKIRLYGIDAPEKKQFFGDSATAFLKNILKDREVSIRVLYKDRYGRSVAKVYASKRYINKLMVKKGYAWWYKFFAKNDLELKNAQKYAKTNKLGLWRYKNITNPYNYRKSHRHR